MVLLGVEPIIERTAEEIKKVEEKLVSKNKTQPLPFLPVSAADVQVVLADVCV